MSKMSNGPSRPLPATPTKKGSSGPPNKPLPATPAKGLSGPPKKPLPAPPGLKGGYQNQGLNRQGKAAPTPPPKPAKFKPGNTEVYRYQDRAPAKPGGGIGAHREKPASASKPLPTPANPARGRTGTFGQAVSKPLPATPARPAAPAPPRPRTGTFGQKT